MKYLVLGSGGREHAIAWKLAQEEKVQKVFVSPGNGGTELEDKCENVDFEDYDKMIEFCRDEKIHLTVVGPEQPLVEGIVDRFKEAGLDIIGPHKDAARLEGSKSFAKEFMEKHGVRTGGYRSFTLYEEALEHINTSNFPLVIKADGLAAGKGVVICEDVECAQKALEDIMVRDIFKEAGKTVVIEEFLQGVEASIVTLFDGERIVPFISCKDHKKIGEGESGLNTGGMGIIAPNPHFTEEMMKDFKENIMLPTLEGLKKDRMEFKGFIFFGVMIKDGKNYLLEYNVRMGDPETQGILSLMEGSFSDILTNCSKGKLSENIVRWKEGSCCGVVLSSEGYPQSYRKGVKIDHKGDSKECKTFFAGAKGEGESLLTSGGRVACITALGKDLLDARKKAYENLSNCTFKGGYYRKDIGK